MENSHSETRLILSLSLQDIDNLAKDLKPRQSAVSVTAFRRDR